MEAFIHKLSFITFLTSKSQYIYIFISYNNIYGIKYSFIAMIS